MQKYQVPDKLLQLIKGYYSNFQLRFTTNDFVTELHKPEVGIMTGCTISVILFATAMKLLSKLAEAEGKGPVTMSGIRQPAIRAFMVGLTMTTKAVNGARWLLTGLQDIVISWSRMAFKPSKSRSLVVKKGKVTRESKISEYIRRWLGLPRSLSNIALYGKSNRLQLVPLRRIQSIRDSSNTSVKDSKDEKVSGASIRVGTGRKWDDYDAESCLGHSLIVGRVAKG